MPVPGSDPVPPLLNGDRLNRLEFERRYQATPNLLKAELIEGVVTIPSSLRLQHDTQLQADLLTWLNVYRSATLGVRVDANVRLRLDFFNELQPCAVLRKLPTVGGHCRPSDEGFLEGPPELILEIMTPSDDFREKLKTYRRHGIKECIVWQIEETRLDWLRLDQGYYVFLQPDGNNMVHSQEFPGLCLPVAEMLAGNLAQVLFAVHKSLRSLPHQAFVKQLQTHLENLPKRNFEF
jgi:Uma2 family endonuclease